MTSDLISRSALLLQLAKTFVPANGLGQGIAMGVGYAIKAIGEAPAVDAVEVVRCKDCKYCRRALDAAEDSFWGCWYYNDAVELNDYCSHGERRGDDGT